ncbi:MAG: hypothetical protein ABGW78_16630 [Pirellulales bacterium]
MSVMQRKSLDEKLSRILADSDCRDFILADAKDADMAFGLAAPGRLQQHTRDGRSFRSIQEYRDCIREIVERELVDIMLMSGSTSSSLAVKELLFESSSVTPAVRMNDTTDIWLATGTGSYREQPALPFSTTTISQAQYGSILKPEGVSPSVNLGLFSITLNGEAQLDRDMLSAYRDFRGEAEQKGFRHFLEVFYPNALERVHDRITDHPKDVNRFLADHVVRLLAGVPSSGRPLFLKIPYLGPEVTEQLVAYDQSVVVGILGGGAGTTHDAFALVADAKKYGARVALFGRKINAAECQITFLTFLRAVADEDLLPDVAVKEYHKKLKSMGISPYRSLSDDLLLAPTHAAYS